MTFCHLPATQPPKCGYLLPGWAADLNCSNWAQFFLSWVISHPAVTCAIPAKSNPDHLDEKMAVLRSPLPDETQREDMLKWFLAT